MHASLIDSHRRSSLNSNEISALTTLYHTSIDNQYFNHQILPDANVNMKNTPAKLDGIIDNEDDEDEKEQTEPVTHSADFFDWTHGHQRAMLTFCTICLFAFMTGVEYAVILPTAFDYVKTMTTIHVYVGLMLSAYSISGSIAGVIMGKISDITGKVKILIIVSNVFQIGGNILYFVTHNIYIVILGRLIAGVGMGAVPPILADVAHRTKEENRTTAVSIILGCRQLGLLIGPCFTLLIRMMNFNIGSIHVNNLNGPGFLMACVWFILQIVCWLYFYDRTPSKTTGPSTSNDSPKHKYIRSDHSEKHDTKTLSLKVYFEQYGRIEMFVLFFATFIAYFNQTALESIVSGFTEEKFNWNTVHTSVLFAFAGLEIIVVYLSLVFVLSKRFEDRFLLVFGFISLTLACVLGTFFTWASFVFGWTGKLSNGDVDQRLFSMFIIFVMLDLLGLPFLAATSVSLFTKLTLKELQGFSQGLQRSLMGIGTIIGPIFATALFNRLHIMMSTMLGLTIMTLLALLFVLGRLRPLSEKLSKEKKDTNNNLNNSSSNEEDPDESALPLSSKNCYVTLVQHDDETNGYTCKKNSQNSPLENSSKYNLNCSHASQINSSTKCSHLYNKTSTDVVFVPNDKHRTILEKSSSRVS